MKNFVQHGHVCTITAPSPLTSGQGFQVGQLFGVASADATAGQSVALATAGVFDLPKEATTDTFAVGDPVEWDAANARVTSLDTGLKVGVAVEAASATASTVRVLLV